MNRTDLQIKRNIEDELRCDPRVAATPIGVSVASGTVTLAGVVDTYVQKWAAEVAARRVAGVRMVTQGLVVRDIAVHKPDRSKIAAAVAGVLRWNTEASKTLTPRVRSGSLALEGQAAIWSSRSLAAEQAARFHAGVVAVYRSFVLRPGAPTAAVREKVTASLYE